MIPYLLLMAVPVLFGLTTSGKRSRATLFWGFLAFTLFAGFRYETGTDWDGYLNHFELVRFKDLPSIWTEAEPGHWTLVYLTEQLGWGLVGLNVIAAIVFFAGLFTFAATTDRPWVAVAVATGYLVLVLSMGGIRQAMAMGLIFLLLARWSRTSNLSKLAIIGAAALFHFSAVLMVVLLAFGQKTRRVVQLGGGILAALALYYIATTQWDNIQHYSGRYIGDGTVQATGAIFHALLNAVPAAGYLLLRKRWERTFGPNQLLFALAIGSLAILPFLAVSTVGVSRVSMYLTPAAMIIWAGMPRVLGGAKGGSGYAAGALAVQVATMTAWLTFANMAFAFFPYRNVLFSGTTN